MTELWGFLIKGLEDPDLIDAVWIKSDITAYLGHCFKWRLVSPNRVDGAIAADGDTVIGGIALVRAECRMFGASERAEINVSARNILNSRICSFTKRQSIAGIGNDPAPGSDHNMRGVCLD